MPVTTRRLAWLTILSLLILGLPVTPASAAAITTSGPLTTIDTSETLNCAVNHVDDTQGEFYADTACGTFVALGGTLYGPQAIPAGSQLGSYTPYTAVSQTTGGSGTVQDPHSITTTVSLGDSGVTLTQVDRYVPGQGTFRTDATLTNDGSSAVSGYLYRAADCYLANSDRGFGSTGADGRVGCTNQTRSMEFVPFTGGSTYYEAGYSEVWAAVATQGPLANTTRAAEDIDNGMALAWSVTAVGGGSQVTVSSATNFGTSTSTGAQIDIVNASTNPSTDSQGRNTFSINRNSSADLTITLEPTPRPGCTIQQVFLNHNGVQFEASDPEGDGTWTATIPRDQLREGDITATIVEDCGTITGSVGVVRFYDPSGIITDASTGQPVSGAEVTLHNVPGWRAQTPGDTGPDTCETLDTRGAGWDQPAPTSSGVVAATTSGTFTPDVNPQSTSPEGRYGWDVVTGCWYVTVTASGYEALTSPVVGIPPEVTDLDLALTPTGSGTGGTGGTGGTVQGVNRLSGAERIATSIAVSQDMWTDGSAQMVLLARHDNYPDSLAGGPLAVAGNGPLLLTTSSGLWADTGFEIMRVLPRGSSVVLLGGVAALSEDVAMDLIDMGYQVFRADGATRYETSVLVARSITQNPTTILVADGNSFGDALIAASAAPAVGATVVLTAGTRLPDEVADYLDANNGATWITIGSAAAAALPNANTRIAGADVYETSTLVADAFWPDATGFAVASGENYPDALAGAAHSPRLGQPLLLSPQAGLTSGVQSWLSANGPFTSAVLYGGPAALSDTVAQQVGAAL